MKEQVPPATNFNTEFAEKSGTGACFGLLSERWLCSVLFKCYRLLLFFFFFEYKLSLRQVKFYDLDKQSLTWIFVLVFSCVCVRLFLKLLYRSANLVTWRDFVWEI